MEQFESKNTKLELNVVDYYCTFNYLLSYIGIEFPETTATCFCPFHENTNTKAAKFYAEEHNEHIFCFAENKQFKPHHLLTNNIVPFSVNHVFSSIWNNLSESEKQIFSSDLKTHTIKQDFNKHFDDYKKCKISYFELLSVIKNA